VSDCCLTQDKQLSAISWRDQLHSEKWWWYPLCTRPNSFNCIFIVHAYCNNTLLVNMSLHADPFSRSRPNVLITNVLSYCQFYLVCDRGANIRSNTLNANLFHFVKKNSMGYNIYKSTLIIIISFKTKVKQPTWI